jgi:proline dehydrogenase
MILRSTLLYLSRQNWLRRWMETSSLAHGLTSRFVAGENLPETIDVCRSLNAQGFETTLDNLGENVHTPEEAKASLDTYLQALSEIHRLGLRSTVSIKLTQFGMDLSEELCHKNVEELMRTASEQGTRVEIDMEASEYTDRTLNLVKAMHAKHRCVRAVIQAYLYRSEADIRECNALRIPVRLCKGAYREPPSVAWPAKADVDRNYLTLIKLLLSEGTFAAVASHDEAIVREVIRFVQDKKIPANSFEFQMLYGIRRDLQTELIGKGYRVRLYVPYGGAWYPYFMRRLAERPANVLFLAKNLARR